MLDVVSVSASAAFLWLALAYVAGCGRLGKKDA